ncbi:MAG TPA: PAC2 family protein [Acidimicrobiia bacterium]|jgi:hypothetical protein
MSWLETTGMPNLRNPVALLAFAGWGDAGESSTGAAQEYLTALEGEVFARIDPDEFFEFQARRPVIHMDDGIRHISWPRNEFHALHHPQGDLVVLLGEEPQLRWRAFCELIAGVLHDLEVTRAVTMGAFLGQVPHSLPVPLIGAAADAKLLLASGLPASGYQGPTGIVGVLTNHLAESGINTVSTWAAVPHYLGTQRYPPGIAALVYKSGELLDRRLDTSALDESAERFRSSVDGALDESQDLREYVERLETAYEDDEGETEDPAALVDEIERYLKDR